jgi:hypothetical protein
VVTGLTAACLGGSCFLCPGTSNTGVTCKCSCHRPCPNPHGPDGVIACWAPGGPCPAGRTVCESCGPCAVCRPGEHPENP